MGQPALLITCEHAGNEVLPPYRQLFSKADKILESHRGWDPGALDSAKIIASTLKAPLFTCLTTRLLIETNRSLTSPQLFSEFTETLSQDQKKHLVEEVYEPYRDEVVTWISKNVPVIHFSIHSFTPVWNGLERNVDVGLLFDPDRKSEKKICEQLANLLKQSLSGFSIQFNEPYHGKDDGFTTYLRTQFDDSHYAGIEIELNQKYFQRSEMKMLAEEVAKSIAHIV